MSDRLGRIKRTVNLMGFCTDPDLGWLIGQVERLTDANELLEHEDMDWQQWEALKVEHAKLVAELETGKSAYADLLVNSVNEVRALTTERDLWFETAKQNQRNTDYYRGLVVQIGAPFGQKALTADDGMVKEDVLCAKVPQLVDDLRQRLAECEEVRDRYHRHWQTTVRQLAEVEAEKHALIAERDRFGESEALANVRVKRYETALREIANSREALEGNDG